jgi:exodeoxyribonuclease-3
VSELSLLTLNIANPSPERAQRQLDWLATRHESAFVLTETKDSAGCRLLADAFTAAGYHVAYPKPDNGDYGVLIASKLTADTDDFGSRVGYLPARAAAITLPAPDGPIHIIGAYVPSRDASAEKTERKRKWLTACHQALASRPKGAAVFLGDLNVLEPGHLPHYPFFAPFEYNFYRQLTDDCGLVDAFRTLHPDTVEHSWVGRTGDGYRYDHAHCTPDLASKLLACNYIHQPRLDRLSDHSALSARLAIHPWQAVDNVRPGRHYQAADAVLTTTGDRSSGRRLRPTVDVTRRTGPDARHPRRRPNPAHRSPRAPPRPQRSDPAHPRA